MTRPIPKSARPWPRVWLPRALAIVAACLWSSVSGARPEPELQVPDVFIGNYASPNCADFSDGGFWALTAHNELFVSSGISVGPVNVVANQDGWLHVVDEGDDAGYFIGRDGRSGDIFFAMRLEGADPSVMPGDRKIAIEDHFSVTRYERCAEVPTEIQMLYGEPLTILRDLDGAISACRNEKPNCLKEVFTVFDVHSNQALSQAELSRAMRFAIFFAASQAGGQESAGVVNGATAGGFLIAPALAQVLMLNFDYDASDSLSMDELLTDHVDNRAVAAMQSAKPELRGLIENMQQNAELLLRLLPGN